MNFYELVSVRNIVSYLESIIYIYSIHFVDYIKSISLMKIVNTSDYNQTKLAMFFRCNVINQSCLVMVIFSKLFFPQVMH